MKTIKELRAEAGLSVRELADYLGVSYASVHGWEHGNFSPTAPTLQALSRAFRIHAEEIDIESPVAARKGAAAQRD